MDANISASPPADIVSASREQHDQFSLVHDRPSDLDHDGEIAITAKPLLYIQMYGHLIKRMQSSIFTAKTDARSAKRSLFRLVKCRAQPRPGCADYHGGCLPARTLASRR